MRRLIEKSQISDEIYLILAKKKLTRAQAIDALLATLKQVAGRQHMLVILCRRLPTTSWLWQQVEKWLKEGGRALAIEED